MVFLHLSQARVKRIPAEKQNEKNLYSQLLMLPAEQQLLIGHLQKVKLGNSCLVKFCNSVLPSKLIGNKNQLSSIRLFKALMSWQTQKKLLYCTFTKAYYSLLSV